jgi:activator of HSP90 ATPase
MLETIYCSTILPASPLVVYQAWLDSQGHSAFTGSPAEVDPAIGGRFTAWDGYITGTTLELEPYRRIVQAWRTSEFPPDSPDSRLEVLLEETPEGVKISLLHSEIPTGQGATYAQGWEDYYFTPMLEYFAGL